MKITVTDFMRERLEIFRRETDRFLGGPTSQQREHARHERIAAALTLARLVAEAVEEQESKTCAEELCGNPRAKGDTRCVAHAEEMRIDRERYLADKRAGKPCVACVFIGSECHDCQDYRETQAKKGGSDA